jgi:hypothetical protein
MGLFMLYVTTIVSNNLAVNELGRMYKKALTASYKGLSRRCKGDAEENLKFLSAHAVCGPRYKVRTSRIRSKRATLYKMM